MKKPNLTNLDDLNIVGIAEKDDTNFSDKIFECKFVEVDELIFDLLDSKINYVVIEEAYNNNIELERECY